MAVFFLYRYFFGRIWSDFFDTIDKIHRFDISSPEKLDFSESMIIEFNELNQVLNKMINKISFDFQGLKDFTGNLTHEMQTPLAIIRSKTDLLIQDKSTNENQMLLAVEINAETLRLSKLIKALTLFPKLGHNQFADKQLIDFEKLIQSRLELFEDFIIARSISVKSEMIARPQIKMNPELADILLTNLIKNSIHHNIENGEIDIQLFANQFIIKNSGHVLNFNPDILFERFSKLSKYSESLGIGLSLAKKICEYYGFKIQYIYKDEMHEIIIDF